MFLEIVRAAGVVRIVETGTYRGTTTLYMRAATGLPVVTVEASPHQVGYCRARFLLRRGIRLEDGDSRSFLRRQLKAGRIEGVQFIYLDAHWGEDLPLADEVQIIRASGCRAVVMVDDFQVPGDVGYGYDDYGPGKRLTVEYLRERGVRPATVFFPSVGSEQETGCKRGSVVFTTDASLDAACRSLASLREGGIEAIAAAPSRNA